MATDRLRLRDGDRARYQRIVRTIKQVAPFFRDFVLEPELAADRVRLRWQQEGSDTVLPVAVGPARRNRLAARLRRIVVMSGPQRGRSAVLAPGGNNNAGVPLLMYAGLAVRRRGGSVRPVTWDLAEGAGIGAQRERVLSAVALAVDELASALGAAPLVIGKSLGSLAAPVVADHGLAAVWFTPLLTDEPTVAALRRARGPLLLAGGTADPYWDGRIARSVTADVVEISGADHAMFVPGRVSASAAVLGEVLTAVEDFFDRAVWP